MTARPRVLLVEDSRTAARMLQRMLGGSAADGPFVVAHVATLEDAGTALAADGPFDAIVLDLTLPDSDGLATYHVVREAAPYTAVVVLSGTEDAAVAREAVDLGAQDFVVKGQADEAGLVRAVEYAIVRQGARAEVGRALRSADEANQRLHDVVTHASHELLSPIATVQALATMLEEHWEHLDDPSRRHQLARIARAARRLARTGTHFLHNAAADAGPVRPRPSTVAPAPLVHDLADDLELASVQVLLDPDVTVHADPVHVETMLSNLLRNAVRHGADPIVVDGQVVGGTVEIGVADHGDGIPAGEATRLFRRFERGATGDAHGSGLGLFVARRMAHANGGDVVHDPTWEAGARFVLSLPLAPVVDAPATRTTLTAA